jgi:hypothetical protein
LICNQCLLPLILWVRISIGVRCTRLCDTVCQWLLVRWFSPGPLVSFTNKTDRHDVTEMLLRVALNTIKQTNKSISYNIFEDLFLFFSCMFQFLTINNICINIILYISIDTDVNNQTTHNVPDNERILINSGDIIGWWAIILVIKQLIVLTL